MNCDFCLLEEVENATECEVCAQTVCDDCAPYILFSAYEYDNLCEHCLEKFEEQELEEKF